MDFMLLIAVLAGISILVFLIVVLRLQAFLALLIASITSGLLAGMEPALLWETVQKGMAGTLGFVATVVGLGAIFGAILEHSNGARAISDFLLKKFGQQRAPLAMTFTGFLLAIPVFFDVAFIILIPVLYGLQRSSGRSLLVFALPLLAGLAVSHAFVPPTPGPVAVAEILGADLGYVMAWGIGIGLPVALVSGLLFGGYMARRVFVEAPAAPGGANVITELSAPAPAAPMVLLLMLLPVGLIIANAALNAGALAVLPPVVAQCIGLLGHPFGALLLANLLAWYLLGIRRGMKLQQLLEISTQSLSAAGTIILLTGAGGVFKQVLTDTGAGKMLASGLLSWGLTPPLMAFFTAMLIRLLQGSVTVAMITAAGLLAPFVEMQSYPPAALALLTIAIASGATTLSHVNDSGFWLVSQYLGMSPASVFRSWSMTTVVLAFTGFALVMLCWLALGY